MRILDSRPRRRAAALVRSGKSLIQRKKKVLEKSKIFVNGFLGGQDFLNANVAHGLAR
jgi:hypothetical protein